MDIWLREFTAAWLSLMSIWQFSVFMGVISLICAYIVGRFNHFTKKRAAVLCSLCIVGTTGWYVIRLLFIGPDLTSNPQGMLLTAMTFTLSGFMAMGFVLGYLFLNYLKTGPRRIWLMNAIEWHQSRIDWYSGLLELETIKKEPISQLKALAEEVEQMVGRPTESPG